MPAASATAVYRDFKRQVDQSIQLVVDTRRRGTPFFQLQQVSELAFLRIYLAWETFLEESFTRFMCGARSVSGSQPRCYADPTDIEHARRFLIGAGLAYADWTDPGLVVGRAELVFREGKPFAAPVRAATTDLSDMKVIRNCVAHRSTQARRKFSRVVQKRLGVARNLAPGSFLLSASPTPNQNFLEFFSTSVSIAAQDIVR